ncbi:MAG: D-hexose-6-phosphate mutarotase [Methylotenera sp.]|nr:D-hexose-6-phosphate mutarotase [Methylotenera sp.]MSP99909.1 D-hexose-6-phosphate mutarotase [Methylotenera sp.]
MTLTHTSILPYPHTTNSAPTNDACQIKDKNGLAYIEIDNRHATAKIALQGAHIMHWQPKSTDQPVFWLSSNARYIAGRSIRGGVPICWPWFGAHPTDSSYCPHGFARVIPWKMIKSCRMPNGTTRILLEMTQTEITKKQLSYPYKLTLEITVGNYLRLEITTTNLADHPFMIGEAYHTYFNVSDVQNTQITGLENLVYSDKVEGYVRNVQHGPLQFNGEFDRVYLNSDEDCIIRDSGFNRAIRVSKSGSKTTVVWSPGAEKVTQMPDMGAPNEWRKMLCVESANAMENSVIIFPRESHTMVTEYSLELF